MTENEYYIHHVIQNQVTMGFSSIEEIKKIIYEQIEDDELQEEISTTWVDKHIEEEMQKIQEESKNWSRPTDTDKLILAFEELYQNNIIALHNPGYMLSEGEYEVVEIEKMLRHFGKESDGYCFYQQQDLESNINFDNGLYITFQKINNKDDEETVALGKKIVTVLKKHGFEINWEETAFEKIEILDFQWQKLFNNKEKNLLDHNYALEFMLKE